MSLPVIGITVDSEQPGGYSKFPWYALRENYSTAVTRAGGLPVLLPNEPVHVEHFLERIDALIVTGGDFDVDPALFGAAVRHPSAMPLLHHPPAAEQLVGGIILDPPLDLAVGEVVAGC